MQPGETIAPNQKPADNAAPTEVTQTITHTDEPPVSNPAPTTQPQTTPTEPPVTPAAESRPPEEPAPFQFNPEPGNEPAPNSPSKPTETVEWTASEYIAHHKQFSWFLGLGTVTAILAAAIYFITKDLISTSMAIVAGGAFGFIAIRKPQAKKYSLSTQNIQIGRQAYTYDTFKSFSIVQEGVIRSIRLLPLKRFMPAIFMYYDPADEDKILGLLSAELPFEKHQPDLVDKLMQQVRF